MTEEKTGKLTHNIIKNTDIYGKSEAVIKTDIDLQETVS